MNHRSRRQAGLGLVEVMVAALVLSVGLIALAKLQIDLVRGSSDARARTVALSLAEAKIEDLRSFGTVDATPGTFAWQDIGDDTGGRLASVGSYGSSLQVGGIQFKREWSCWPPTPGVCNELTPPGGGTESRYKEVAVTVSWRGPTDTVDQSVVLNSAIAAANPADIVLPGADPASQPGPRVNYTPGDAPTIIAIPIDLGGGRKRETTKPLPDVSVAGGQYHQVTFDVVNFTVGSPTVVDKREEFATVNCRCRLAGPGTSHTPARVKFNDGQLGDEAGQIVSKSQTGTSADVHNPALCTVCCRDHHDGPEIDGNPNRYNPTDSTDHRHYRVSGGSYVQATSTGDEYDEACRLKRVNGVFQVFEDWNLKAMAVVPTAPPYGGPGYLDDGTSTQALYVDYVQDVVRAVVSADTLPNIHTALPHGDPIGDPSHSRDVYLQPNGRALLYARGIYVDAMPAELLTFVGDRIAAGLPWLEFVPFYEINLSKLADWELNLTTADNSIGTATANAVPCPPGGASSRATMTLCVTNEAIVDEGLLENNYSRGEAVAGGTGGVRQAEAKAKTGNSGIAGAVAISASDASTQSDFTHVTNGAATSGTVSGKVTFCGGIRSGPAKTTLYTSLSIGYSGGASGTCTKNRLSGGKGSYNCSGITYGTSITVTPSGVTDASPDNYTLTVDATTTASSLDFAICNRTGVLP